MTKFKSNQLAYATKTKTFFPSALKQESNDVSLLKDSRIREEEKQREINRQRNQENLARRIAIQDRLFKQK